MRYARIRFRLPACLSAAFAAALTMSVLVTPASAATSATEAEAMILGWLNRDRIAAGLRPLQRDYDLAVIAGRRAVRMASANVLNHSIGGHIPSQLGARDVRWAAAGENIGYSHRAWTVEAARNIYQMWKGSSSHRRLMMGRGYDHIGVGLAYRSSAKRAFASAVFADLR
jgi:uncharacterized protein YkwD